MFSALFHKKLVRSAAALAAIGAIAGVTAAGGSPAQADPQQYTAPIFGFGSDTTQDVINAFAGFSNSRNFVPLQSQPGNRQIVSWDAFPVNSCISPKVGGPNILRPNGSTNGQRILSAAFSPANDTWPFVAANPPLCGGVKNPQGLVDFARSSSGPGTVNASGPLSWVPFGRDALSFGYVRPTGSAVVSITSADMSTLHSSGPQLIGGVPVIACGIQTGSGTYSSWMTANGLATNGTGDGGTATCNSVLGVPDTGGRLQENNGPDLLAKAALLSSMTHPICDGVAGGAAVSCTNAQLVVGFSASQYIARSNGVGTPNPNLEGNPAISGMGRINGQQAVSGTIPNLIPVAAAYNNTTFGRDVYNVVPFESIDTVNFTEVAYIVDMFVGASSSICEASATIQQHGFLAITNCGDTTLRGNFRTS